MQPDALSLRDISTADALRASRYFSEKGYRVDPKVRGQYNSSKLAGFTALLLCICMVVPVNPRLQCIAKLALRTSLTPDLLALYNQPIFMLLI